MGNCALLPPPPLVPILVGLFVVGMARTIRMAYRCQLSSVVSCEWLVAVATRSDILASSDRQMSSARVPPISLNRITFGCFRDARRVLREIP